MFLENVWKKAPGKCVIFLAKVPFVTLANVLRACNNNHSKHPLPVDWRALVVGLIADIGVRLHYFFSICFDDFPRFTTFLGFPSQLRDAPETKMQL